MFKSNLRYIKIVNVCFKVSSFVLSVILVVTIYKNYKILCSIYGTIKKNKKFSFLYFSLILLCILAFFFLPKERRGCNVPKMAPFPNVFVVLVTFTFLCFV